MNDHKPDEESTPVEPTPVRRPHVNVGRIGHPGGRLSSPLLLAASGIPSLLAAASAAQREAPTPVPQAQSSGGAAGDPEATPVRHTIPAKNWHMALAEAVRTANPGDTIEVRSSDMAELGESARSRMCPEKPLTFEVVAPEGGAL